MAVGNCSITNCDNKGSAGGNDNFFRIPKDVKRALQWLRHCKKGTNLKSGRICSRHFVATDYKSVDKSRPYLTEHAVPTQCLSDCQSVNNSVHDESLSQSEVKTETNRICLNNFKDKLHTVLYCMGYCGVCLDNTEDNVYIPGNTVNIVDASGDRHICLGEIIDEIFQGQDPDMLASQYLCKRCIESILNSYVFVQKAKLTSRMLHQQIAQLSENADLILKNIDELAGTDHVILTTFPLNTNQLDEGYHIDDEPKEQLDTEESYQGCDNCESCPRCPTQPCHHEEYLKHFAEQYLTSSSEYKCLLCDQTIRTKSLYIEHLDTSHQISAIICDVCGEMSHTRSEMNKHKLEFHCYLSDYCDSEFECKNTIDEHKEFCNDELKLDSENCYLKIDHEEARKAMIFHVDTAHPTITVHCSVCHLAFKSRKELLNHRRTHPPNSKHCCRICKKLFKTNRTCKDHELTHTKPRLIKPPGDRHLCDTCGRDFVSIGELNAHRKDHTGTISCKVCGKQLKASSMKSHMWRHRGYARDPCFQEMIKQQRLIYRCDSCDYKTSSKLYLESHVNRFHLEVRPFVCSVCSKTFSGEHLLQIHMEVHNRSLKYPCAVCGRNFGRALGLKMHERSAHTGERPYCCDECGDKFISTSLLSRHKRMAHSRLRFKCPLCHNKLSSLPELRRHLKRVHWRGQGEPELAEIPGLSKADLRMLEDRRRAPLPLPVRGAVEDS